MTNAELIHAIERKDLDLADHGGIAQACVQIAAAAGERGITFPEIAEILFADEYNLEDCEELGFKLQDLYAGQE
jgi:hypothetical protein